MTMQEVVFKVKKMEDKNKVKMHMVGEVVGLWMGMLIMVHIVMLMMILQCCLQSLPTSTTSWRNG